MTLRDRYICPDCREIVDELPSVAHRIRENFGTHRAAVALGYRESTRCSCGGSYEPAEECKCCGELFAENELNREGLCGECEGHTEIQSEDRLSPRFAPRGVGTIKRTWVPTEHLIQKEGVINVVFV